MDTYFLPTPHAQLISGGPASGKSTYIAQQARTASCTGKDVLVVCADDRGACHMQQLLGKEACSATVLSIEALLQRIIADERTAEIAGRPLRVLDAIEEQIFFEDMRPSGIKQRRLKDLMGFLKRGWCEFADDDPDWIMTLEEQAVVDLIASNLAFTQGVLPEEVPGIAARALLASDALRSTFGAQCVFVDDYHLLCRASQACLCALAQEEITVALSSIDALPVAEQFISTTTVQDFMAANPEAHTVELEGCHRPKAIVAALNGLLRDIDTPELACAASVETDGSVEATCVEGVVDEFRLIASTILEAQRSGVDLCDIAVVATNGVWRKNLMGALAQVGIATHSISTKRPKAAFCDKRFVAKQRAQVAQQLAANANDSLAWRRWLALDDALALSAPYGKLRSIAAPQGLTLAQALRLLDADELPGAQASDPIFTDLLASWRLGLEAIGRATVTGTSESKQNAAASNSRNTTAAQAVSIGKPTDLFSREFDLVIFGGFMDGFIPSRDYFDISGLVGEAKKRAHFADVHACVNCLTSARQRVVFTAFSSCSLEMAERLQLRIMHISNAGDERICTVQQSELASLIMLAWKTA